MHVARLCVLGGTGLLGSHIVAALADRDIGIRVPTRNRERHRELLVVPNVELIEADLHDPATLPRLLSDCDAALNLVGILNEHRKDDFRRVHVELPRRLAEICRQHGVRRLLHVSALGAGTRAPSRYLQSKAEGERLLHEAGADGRLAVTSFRPSVMFGPGDQFLCRFARLLRLAPGIMPLPTPQTRFAPVYVGDVAAAIIRAMDDRETIGKIYELCGPSSYTLQELVQYVAAQAGIRRKVWGLSDGLSRLLARLPGKAYTLDNYLSSQIDSVCGTEGLTALGVTPTALETIAPGYLADVRLRRRYNIYRRNARRGRAEA